MRIQQSGKVFRAFLTTFVLLLCVGTTTVSRAQTGHAQDETPLQTLSTNMLASGTEDAPVHKWAKDIRVTVISRNGVPIRFLGVTGGAFSSVEQLTPLRVVYGSDRANFFIIFVDDIAREISEHRQVLKFAFSNEKALDDYLQRSANERRNYLTLRGHNARSEVAVFCLMVALNRSEGEDDLSPENYLLRGILSGLGFGSGSVTSDSVFNTELNRKSFSDIDRKMLEAFYIPAVRPGMPFSAARIAMQQKLEQ